MAEKKKPAEVPPQTQPTPGMENEMTPKPEIIRKNYKGSEKLIGKVAIITGGDSGIGRSVAVHFAREGADIAIVYNIADEDAEDTQQLVEKEGRECLLLKGDLKDRKFCEKIVEDVIDEYGRINILVNNAAEQSPVDNLEEMDMDVMEDTFRTNIFSFFYLTKEALKHMNEGDTIINSTSVTSFRGSPQLIDYSSTKGAITSFTRSLALNVAERKIRVNGVAPGPIWTPLIPSTFDKEKVKNFGKNVPLGRPGQPSEVAPAYVFLASEDASYITGQIIHPNGGEVVNA